MSYIELAELVYGFRLNIGSGGRPFKGWINLDYPNEHFQKVQSTYQFIPYDIRNDIIPFNDNSVDAVYCSHVIEHIENNYVQKMLDEFFRVLKKGNVLRLVCPDAEFLYEVSKHPSDFWEWRYESIKNDLSGLKTIQQADLRPVDYLVNEVAAEKLFLFDNEHRMDYYQQFQLLDMDDFFEFLTGDLQYTDGFFHINYFTFKKLETMLHNSGFENIIRSKYGACSSNIMRDPLVFDTSGSALSLYVDAIK
ncbi:hypothetical protein FACS1894137_02890 [Spirochaetia bacterium]|nr:hypothetical protein FACS1894137_02890 [Spirochaetia bacterium]